jgi:hypothetical protein
MTKEEFIETITPYLILYGINLEPIKARLWFEACNRKKITPIQFKAAFDRFIDTSDTHWFPVPSEVLSLVESKTTPYFETESGKLILQQIEQAEK